MPRIQISPDAHFYVSPGGTVIARDVAGDQTLELTPDVLVILSELARPRDRAQVVALLAQRYATPAARLDDLLDELLAAGILVTAGRRRTSAYFDSYGDLLVHNRMIADEPRTEAFRRAIEASVRRGSRVLDIGCGTGILSLFAARAGATVDAVDNAGIIDLARALVRKNRLDRRITLHGGDVEELPLPGPYDVILSEWLGAFAVGENMAAPVFAARDRWLAPGGLTIPAAVELHLAPIEDARLHDKLGPGLWQRPVHGLDFTPLADAALAAPISSAADVPAASLLADPARLVRVDCARDPRARFHEPFDAAFTLARAATLHGFAGWFTADLAPGITLDTGPGAPPTHWRQHYFPTDALRLRRGDTLAVTLHIHDPHGGRRVPVVTVSYALHRKRKRVAAATLRYDTRSD